MRSRRLTHLDEKGRAAMVDVSGKEVTSRVAAAEGAVTLGAEALRLLRKGALAKGDALAVARLAGIQAAKRTSEWIPLCHQVPLDGIDVEITLPARGRAVRIRARVKTRFSTGVEMEALVAVSAAALALYDMTKGVDRGATIGPIRLVEKRGGRSGTWTRRLVR
jgi:cyclic pyranopterin monophosphate synthase